ncbi:hypothetical protein GDO78_003144 [Eleutherodactylus coqui]|uniref:Uncharacterized protein n=1 Tax=Eleutherodactylus coqui TaxID=57060 RepID=A0A8J6EUW2_ELECQ|nr:hypothetical protein GDO78_003144 [Eleutherodactylus coqui]
MNASLPDLSKLSHNGPLINQTFIHTLSRVTRQKQTPCLSHITLVNVERTLSLSSTPIRCCYRGARHLDAIYSSYIYSGAAWRPLFIRHQ